MSVISIALIFLPLVCSGVLGHINLTLDNETATAALPPCLIPLVPIDLGAGCVVNSTTISMPENVNTNEICITCPGANATRSEEAVLAELKAIVNERQNTWSPEAKLYIRFHSTAATLQSLDDLEPQIDKNLNAVVYVFDNGTDAIYRPKMHAHGGDAQLVAIVVTSTDAATSLNSRALIGNDNIMAASSDREIEEHSVDSALTKPHQESHAAESVGEHEYSDGDGDEDDETVVVESVTPESSDKMMLERLRMEAAADMSTSTTTTTSTEAPLRVAPRGFSETVETQAKKFPNGTVLVNQTSRNVSESTTSGGNITPVGSILLLFAVITAALYL